jgi:hypothetical protein
MKWFKKPITLARIDILGVPWNMCQTSLCYYRSHYEYNIIITTWAIINYYITMSLLMFQDTVEYCMVSVPMPQLQTTSTSANTTPLNP